MALARKPFQGVGNILRFNWPFYGGAVGVLILLFVGSYWLPAGLQGGLWLGIAGAFWGILVSTIVSWWAYDASDLYHLKWLPQAGSAPAAKRERLQILNITAGFDEVSSLLEAKYPQANLTIADFYDGTKHTEPSIRRARKAYPPAAGTVLVETQRLIFADASFDMVVAMLALHEIRDTGERTRFMKEIYRVLKPAGKVYLTEHLRDVPNFGAYNIGAFHFHSRRSWLQNFREAHFRISTEGKTTPFITTFVLEKNGDPT